MERAKLTVPSNVAYCRGRACDNLNVCGEQGMCSYRSSSEEYRAAMRTVGDPIVTETPFPSLDENSKALVAFDAGEVKPVEDFAGKVDGAGYKGSMNNPKKWKFSLIWTGFIAGLARVLMFGAKKYAAGNWMRGMAWSEVLDAIVRHVAAIESGEDRDPESGELHVYHIACNAMFLSRFMELPEYKQFDDRLFRGDTKC